MSKEAEASLGSAVINRGARHDTMTTEDRK
jgi:hypothetical protein